MTGPTPNEANGSVTYTVKELLGRIDVKIDHVVEKLDTKADEAAVLELTTRVATLENEAASRSSVNAYRRWVFGLAAATMFQAAGLALALIKLF